MLSFTDIVLTSAFLAVARGHGVILGAQGTAGSPASVGFKVDPALARNCTTINPCQQDATLIRDAEIVANVVNECGRTELSGNIDVGENTENAISAGKVTKIQSGGQLTVTIHQVNADGAGPYSCDLDPTGNSLGASGQIPLTVTNNVPGVNGFSQAKAQEFNITVTMPADLACSGASTGNVCTVRCRNAAVAGPFGGCFPVQQTDVKATKNDPKTIKSIQDLKIVLSQVQANSADLPAAVANNQAEGSADGKAKALAASKLLGTEAPVIKDFPAENTGPGASSSTNSTVPAAAPAPPAAAPAAAKPAAAKPKGNKGAAKSKIVVQEDDQEDSKNERRANLRWAARRNVEEVEAEDFEEDDE